MYIDDSGLDGAACTRKTDSRIQSKPSGRFVQKKTLECRLMIGALTQISRLKSPKKLDLPNFASPLEAAQRVARRFKAPDATELGPFRPRNGTCSTRSHPRVDGISWNFMLIPHSHLGMSLSIPYCTIWLFNNGKSTINGNFKRETKDKWAIFHGCVK